MNLIIDFFVKGHPRSIKATKNIIASLGLKSINVLISFLLVPLTINYLTTTKYGIWLTISSIVGWFGYFDIGLGNGLRNKLAEAFAVHDNKMALTYVSTTYAILTLIMSSVFLIFLIINPFLNWTKILNTNPEMARELSWVVTVVFTFFALQFVLKLIGVIFIADQLPAYNNAFGPLGNILAFISIYLIIKCFQGNLLNISFIYSASPVLILIIASIYFYHKKYSYLKPNIKFVDFKYLKSLAGVGLQFFILQIACLILFTTDNLIITQLLGPTEVTSYNIAYKYFSIPIMIFSIIVMPFWSAFTEAFVKTDIIWIKTTIKKLIKIWMIVILGVIILLLISNKFYRIWVGNKVKIPTILSINMGLYTIIYTWNNIFTFFINGVGKIRLQMYYGIAAMFINIPISIYFAKYLKMGSAGVILGTCVSLLLGFIFGPIQYKKIISGNAQGIWNK